ncbi:hypothetical protein F3Y22_tig00110576pilonHSYRG00034 [Hibiscus syriacus]|uniref:Gamma-tubulin complex component n=1 Tax=Hibiscus syriacus TaxID=106335 RepID=A0A6A3A5Y7_HIBSY|nr:hypothetical protein F3Y22_tig00110576pilonHSYRG00034 [Hibiscus syriacus]
MFLLWTESLSCQILKPGSQAFIGNPLLMVWWRYSLSSVYKSAVLQIEQKLLSDTTPILATVTQGLNKFFFILPPLYELILEIERDDIRGGQLLNLLHKLFHCGVPELQACIQRLLWHGHQVLYNQLSSWMVYGILQDQHGEFFIRRQEDQDMEYDSSISDTSLGFSYIPEGYCDVNWVFENDEVISTSEYVFTLGGAAISWKSVK